MINVRCPKCGRDVTLNYSNAIDELGEVFSCPYCQYEFRFVEK